MAYLIPTSLARAAVFIAALGASSAAFGAGIEVVMNEAKIVKLYYGLDGNEPLTLREIGSIFNLSRERIRQIKERAIERLRHQSRARRLQPYH